ncbi:MAG TPA: NADH-quinone oxidoreductase subunit NuoH [Tepidisphaeraceae bacterium]|jgi:NADH-quinone oxidoreductase subunit H
MLSLIPDWSLFNWLSAHVPPWVWLAFIIHLAVLGTVAYLILLERKTASWVQDRLGPNRVGPWGLLQPIADGLKFVLKEDYRPKNVDKVLFTIAPGIMMLTIIISIAVIPWGGIKQTVTAPGVVIAGATKVAETPTSVTWQWNFQIANLNVGVLYIIATLSLAVYGVVIGGWASNNKYSFLGGLRATANMISYEIPLGLCVLCIVLMFGTLDLGEIVAKQAHYWLGIIPAWNVFTQPIAFLLFLVCIHAEANRAPFDLAEAEQELVGGYHTEYSSMRFALFFLAEYAGMITTSAACVALFFGGWHIPWLDKIPAIGGYADPNNPAITTSLAVNILRSIVFFAKMIGIIFIFMWVRWSLPRFRFDQLMDIAWRALIPMSLAMTVCTALIVWWQSGISTDGLRVRHAIWFTLMNVVVLAGAVIASKLLPAAPATNRRVKITNSRFARTPVPAS